jgi:Tol biopolymer transport system component
MEKCKMFKLTRSRKTTQILIIISLIVVTGLMLSNCQQHNTDTGTKFPTLIGSYLDQKPPGEEPVLFAPGIVSTAMYTRDLSITQDGKEIFFCVTAYGFNLIFHTRQKNGVWTEPRPAPFIRNPQYMYYEPCVTPDGKRLFFLSNMPKSPGESENEDIWVVDRSDTGWGELYNLGAPVNSENSEFYPSVTRDGTIYFTRQEKGSRTGHIYRSRLVNGKYIEPEKLPEQVNCGTNRFNAYIQPEEKYIIVPAMGRDDSYGGTDYYVVFHNQKDQWSDPINLGDKINTASGREFSASLSPDGKYFFFMSTRLNPALGNNLTGTPIIKLAHFYGQPQNGNADIYWVKADFIEKLRPDGF